MFDHRDGAEVECPISTEMLGTLVRAETALIGEMVAGLPRSTVAQLSIYCYGRAHLRDLGMALMGHCDVRHLVDIAGVMGQVIARQSRDGAAHFGRDGIRTGSGRRKVTLARAAA